MGKGDKKSKKGKRFSHSYGKTRSRKKDKRIIPPQKKSEEKQKAHEPTKQVKQEPEIKKPPVVEPKVEKIPVKEPETAEVVSEMNQPEV